MGRSEDRWGLSVSLSVIVPVVSILNHIRWSFA